MYADKAREKQLIHSIINYGRNIKDGMKCYDYKRSFVIKILLENFECCFQNGNQLSMFDPKKSVVPLLFCKWQQYLHRLEF